MGILATNEKLDNIIERAAKRVGENHAQVRDKEGMVISNEGESYKYAPTRGQHPHRLKENKGKLTEAATAALMAPIEKLSNKVTRNDSTWDSMTETEKAIFTLLGYNKKTVDELQEKWSKVPNNEKDRELARFRKDLKERVSNLSEDEVEELKTLIAAKSGKNKDKGEVDEAINESLKNVSIEEAQKLVLENTLKGMVKEELEGKKKEWHPYQFKSHGPYRGTEGGYGYDFKSKGPNQYDNEKNREKYIEELKQRLTDTIKEQYTEKTKKPKNIKPSKRPIGLKKYEDVHKSDGKENDDYLKSFKTKMKNYLNFDNNSNPEFPHQNNSKTDYDSPAYRNNTEQDEYIEDWRGNGLEDLEYDTEPSDQFKKRFKDYLEGSVETGNDTSYANAIPSKEGKRVYDKTKRKHKKLKSPEVSYAIPNDWTQKPNAGFIPENVEEEIGEIKKLWGYNQSTQ